MPPRSHLGCCCFSLHLADHQLCHRAANPIGELPPRRYPLDGLFHGSQLSAFLFLASLPQAIAAFAQNGQVTLGGSMSVAAGPLGRNLEADVALRKPASFYTYSKTRGLFIGVTIEGSVMIERKNANRR